VPSLRLALASAVVASALGALLAGPAWASGPIAPKLDVSATLLNQPPGRPWAIDLGVGLSMPTTDGSAPSPLSRAVFRFPHATINSDAFPSCTHDVLERKGPNACPRRSKVGKGTALVNLRPLVKNQLHATLDAFLGPGRGANRTFLFLARGIEVKAVFVLDGKLSRAGGRYGYKLDLSIPPLKTIPGAPDVSIDSFEITIGSQIRKDGRKVSLLEAPTKCPKAGLPFDSDLTFADGQHRTAAAMISCTLRSVPV
jgi:hypothetical protein